MNRRDFCRNAACAAMGLAAARAWSAEGKTIRWIAHELDVSKSLIYKMMKEDREAVEDGGQSNGLVESVKNGRDEAVSVIESTMYASAIGFTKTVKRYYKVKRAIYDEETGRKIEEYEDFIEREEEVYFPPDNTAAIFLLKNWGGYSNEPATNRIREREVDLREKQVNKEIW